MVGWLAAAPGISEVVRTKSANATFTDAFELRLVDGKIWWRPRSTTASALEPWTLFPKDGVPTPPSKLAAVKERLGLRGTVRAGAFDAAARLVAIAADGDDLVAVDERQRVYTTRLDRVRWSDRFAPGPRGAPLRVPSGSRIAMSVRRQPYLDVDGNAHAPDGEVATLYALTSDGARLLFSDRRDKNRLEDELCLPERGAFRGAALAATASTVAVLDDAGRVFTRLADYDSLGHDGHAFYSWRRERRTGARSEVRSLPPEPWREQPPLPGPFARELTVLAAGPSAGARELRVPTDGGYFHKPMQGGAWAKVVTGVARHDVAPAAALPTRGPRRTKMLPGAIWHGASTRLQQFDPVCPPAEVVVERDGERVMLELWMRENLERLAHGRELSGALVLPASAKGALATDLRALLGDTTVEVKIDIDERRVSVRSANRTRSEPRLSFTRR